ncbi:MAG: hypothetical protein AABY07_03425 [Nanoarchaeota archaeon]
MEIIKITPDKERAKSILKMTCLIEERIKIQNKEKMAALIITDYYEIIKELITAILLIDGYKILSHKDLIDYLKEKYFDKFNAYDVSVLDDLRILRNRIAYEGFFVEPSYLDRNETVFTKIIKKLKELIENKLK